MNSIGESIKRARLARGLTQKQLGEMVGLDNGNLSRLEKGKQGASQATLDAICTALGISLSGAIAANTMRLNAENTGIPSSSAPVILFGQIATWIAEMENFKKQDAAAWIACPVEHGPRTFAVIVVGESMHSPASAPSFADGDYAFCDPDKAPRNGGLVIAQLPAADSRSFEN